MEKNNITADKITKPIQLLGAWLAGLLAINSSFLIAAVKMGHDTWQAGFLTVASILNVPAFLIALFILQTKFRPELQEDQYYSNYLNSLTNEPIKLSKLDIIREELERRIDGIETKLLSGDAEPEDLEEQPKLTDLLYGMNIHLGNKKKVLSKLNELGVIGVNEFGKDIKPPEINKVAINKYVPLAVRKEIIQLASSLGFTHYGIMEPSEDIKEDVLFGAYGKDVRRITSV